MCYTPLPGAYPVFRALCPESGVLLGVCNGYAPENGVYLLLGRIGGSVAAPLLFHHGVPRICGHRHAVPVGVMLK